MSANPLKQLPHSVRRGHTQSLHDAMMSIIDPLEVFRASAVPCIAVGTDERIRLFNAAAGSFFNVQPDQALGKPCYQVVEGCDVFGNRYCGVGCPLLRMARDGEPVRPTEISLPGAGGNTRRIAVLSIAVPTTDAGPALVHLFHESFQCSPASAALPVERSIAISERTAPTLTEREIQVLRLIAEAASTREIAERLSISTATVRNHVQHVLDKLGVSGKLEAVLFAKRNGLL